MFFPMLHPHFRGCIFVLISVLDSTACFAAQTTNASADKISFEIGPVPGWVKPLEAPVDAEIGGEGAGVIYLLADRQDNLERRAFYYHEVRKVTSESGAKNSSSISISFDPAFESLTFHSVRLTRKGTVSNRLDRSRIKLARRESDPERSVYDTAWTAQPVLDDVRIGDIIEFAFSREGVSPLRRGKYAATFLLQWEALILHNVVRVIYPANRTLSVRAENGARNPKVTTANGLTELWYESHNIPGRTIEDDAPDDYEPRERLDVSEFHDWGEVAQWATPLFQTEPPHSSEFNSEVAKLRSIIDPAQRVVAALEFVQDQIRYVKVTTWLGLRPLTNPDLGTAASVCQQHGQSTPLGNAAARKRH